MPIVASMGGNAGMQTLAVTIRSIATNELTKNNFSQNVIKEFSIGILNGVIFAIISAIVVHIWFNDLTLSLIISISMVLNMIVAGLFGILVPITLKKFNIDPAIASSVFVTTITDVIGFLSFLGVGVFFFIQLKIINKSYISQIIGYKNFKIFFIYISCKIIFISNFEVFNSRANI